MEHVRVHIDAEVKCTDQEGGRVARVIIDPSMRKVTHWVVRLLNGDLRVVGSDSLVESHPGWIKLNLRYAQLQEAPLFVITDYSLPSAEWGPPYGYRHADVLWLSDKAKFMSWDLSPGPLPIEHDALAPSERQVAEGSRVHCRDRECGRISEVVWNPETRKALGFVVRRGFLFHRDVSIPMGWIERIDESGVYLKMTAKQVEELAQHFPPEA